MDVLSAVIYSWNTERPFSPSPLLSFVEYTAWPGCADEGAQLMSLGPADEADNGIQSQFEQTARNYPIHELKMRKKKKKHFQFISNGTCMLSENLSDAITVRQFDGL